LTKITLLVIVFLKLFDISNIIANYLHKNMFKNKLFKYFSLELLKSFSVILVTLSFIIWFNQAARYLDLVTENGNPINVYLIFVFFQFPKIFSQLFLFSLLVSLFYTISKLENENELNVYWLSGVDEKQLITMLLKVCMLIFFIYYFLYLFLSPMASLKGRSVLANSSFTIANSLMKEKNFNTPLKGITVYVDKNNKKGALENIFIYEKQRIIFASKGRILKNKDLTYLELSGGILQEQDGEKTNNIKFEKMTFDFSEFESFTTTYPKLSERNILWLIKKNLELKQKLTDKKYEIDVKEELYKRIIKPLYIFVIFFIGCCLISYKENIPKKKRNIKIILFFLGVTILLINESLIKFSARNIFIEKIYFLSPVIFSIFVYLLNKKISRREAL